MGEYAEMMLDGTCCSSCGDFLDIDGMADGVFEAAGYAVMCESCQRIADRYEPRVPRFNRYAVKPSPKEFSGKGKVRCPVCQKSLKAAGVGDHIRDVHPETQIATGGN